MIDETIIDFLNHKNNHEIYLKNKYFDLIVDFKKSDSNTKQKVKNVPNWPSQNHPLNTEILK